MKTILSTIHLISLCLISSGCIFCQVKNDQQNASNISETPIASPVLFKDLYKQGSIKEEDLALMYLSPDNGKTWTPFAKGIPKKAVVSAYATLENKIYACTDYHGVFVSKDGLNDWKKCSRGLPDKIDINAIIAFGKTLVIGTFQQGIFISKDGGANWIPSKTKFSDIPIRTLIHFGDKLFVGTDNGIYKSNDQGQTWDHIHGSGMQINGFTIFQSKLYAATVSGAIMSKDNGATWKQIYKDYTLHDISSDSLFIYALTIGGGLFRSKNDGQTWEDISQGIDPISFYTFKIRNIGTDLFAAQHFGIYHSSDHGNHWHKLQNEFPNTVAFLFLETTNYGLITGIKV